MQPTVTRRSAMNSLAAATGATLSLPAAVPAGKGGFTPCLNMSTLRGHNLGFARELETAAKAGFRSVEIWMDTLQTYLAAGNTPAQAGRLLADHGLAVENTIGFAPWIVDDAAARTQGLEQFKREADILARIGCRRMAAPPVGAHQTPGPRLELPRVTERYHALLELGVQAGVVPQLELWGFAANLSRLAEVLYVAVETSHPAARVLLDVYHLYKGGSGVEALPLVGHAAVEIFHINDYPASLTPAVITDADRIYPGDGAAPLRRILQALRRPGVPVVLSFEVFNKSYYAQNPLLVARTALQKMKAVMQGV